MAEVGEFVSLLPFNSGNDGNNRAVIYGEIISRHCRTDLQPTRQLLFLPHQMQLVTPSFERHHLDIYISYGSSHLLLLSAVDSLVCYESVSHPHPHPAA